MLAGRLRALSDPARLRLCLLLRDRRELSIASLAHESGQAPTTVARHLRRLEEATLVAKRRSGRHNLFRLLPESMPDTAALFGDVHTERADLSRLQYLSRIAEQIGEGVSVMDTSGCVTYVNPAAARMLGVTAEEMIGHPLASMARAEHEVEEIAALRARAQTEGTATVTFEHQRADGTVFPAELTLSNLTDDDGTLLGTVISVRDMTAWLTAERKRQSGERRLEATILTLPDLIVHLDSSGNFLYASPSCGQALGGDPELLKGVSVFDFIHRDDQARVMERAQERLNEPLQAPVAPLEMRLQHADGHYVWYEAIANPLPPVEEGDSAELVVSLRSIVDRKLFEEHLLEQAGTDSLTGLANHRRLLEHLERALEADGLEGDAGSEVAVIYVDLDGFKAVNDTLGHGAGDELLIEAAQRLIACVRGADTVARLGGDEFVLLLRSPSTPEHTAAVVARVTTALAEPFVVAETTVQISGSVGHSRSSRGGSVITAEELLVNADQDMYRAKHRAKRDRQLAGVEVQLRALKLPR